MHEVARRHLLLDPGVATTNYRRRRRERQKSLLAEQEAITKELKDRFDYECPSVTSNAASSFADAQDAVSSFTSSSFHTPVSSNIVTSPRQLRSRPLDNDLQQQSATSLSSNNVHKTASADNALPRLGGDAGRNGSALSDSYISLNHTNEQPNTRATSSDTSSNYPSSFHTCNGGLSASDTTFPSSNSNSNNTSPGRSHSNRSVNEHSSNMLLVSASDEGSFRDATGPGKAASASRLQANGDITSTAAAACATRLNSSDTQLSRRGQQQQQQHAVALNGGSDTQISARARRAQQDNVECISMFNHHGSPVALEDSHKWGMRTFFPAKLANDAAHPVRSQSSESRSNSSDSVYLSPDLVNSQQQHSSQDHSGDNYQHAENGVAILNNDTVTSSRSQIHVTSSQHDMASRGADDLLGMQHDAVSSHSLPGQGDAETEGEHSSLTNTPQKYMYNRIP